MRLVFVTAVLALPFVAFAALTMLRKARYRSLASKLGAKHVPTGLLEPGAISGDGFRVEVDRVGKRYRTNVHVSVGVTPGTFWLEPEFFHAAPNWECVRVPGSRTSRVFAWELTVRGHVRPDREQQETLMRWLPRSSDLPHLRDALKRAGVRSIAIADGSISAEFDGITSSDARIRGALQALGRLVPSSAADGRR